MPLLTAWFGVRGIISEAWRRFADLGKNYDFDHWISSNTEAF
jgi:hypothetical protein